MNKITCTSNQLCLGLTWTSLKPAGLLPAGTGWVSIMTLKNNVLICFNSRVLDSGLHSVLI